MKNLSTKTLFSMLVIGLVAAALSACGAGSTEESGPAGNDGSFEVVPPGKSDNYFSDVAQEFTVTGRTTAILDDSCVSDNEAPDAKEQCQLQSIGLKNFAIGWFLNAYVIDKHDSANEDWGGFTAMTRPESYEALEIGEPGDDGKFDYTFTSELSGPLGLLDKMPTEACSDDATKRCFKLEIPVLDNATLSQMETGSEWYRKAPYNAYAPELYTGDKETLELAIEAYPRSNDAYLEYDKLFSPDQLAIAGGKLRIGLFVGWDYYDARYDLQTAKELYRYLEAEGFKSPVASYDDLKIDSGDFTKTILVNGKEIEVEVLLVHPGQGDPGDAEFAGQMKQALVDAFSTRQMITFEGHAGPLYGFALGNWRATEAGELDDSELPFLDIPPGFYQVVMASGCDTYMVADSMYQIPVKAGRVDLDIITTTSFSNAGGRGRTTKALVEAIINQDGADGGLEPQTYGEILRELNREYWFNPLYGVHGIDDNPRSNPFAETELQCSPCSSHDECGGFGNFCVTLNDGAFCTTKCQTDSDCGQGEVCWELADGDTIVGSNCIPTGLTCN